MGFSAQRCGGQGVPAGSQRQQHPAPALARRGGDLVARQVSHAVSLSVLLGVGGTIWESHRSAVGAPPGLGPAPLSQRAGRAQRRSSLEHLPAQPPLRTRSLPADLAGQHGAGAASRRLCEVSPLPRAMLVLRGKVGGEVGRGRPLPLGTALPCPPVQLTAPGPTGARRLHQPCKPFAAYFPWLLFIGWEQGPTGPPQHRALWPPDTLPQRCPPAARPPPQFRFPVKFLRKRRLTSAVPTGCGRDKRGAGWFTASRATVQAQPREVGQQPKALKGQYFGDIFSPVSQGGCTRCQRELVTKHFHFQEKPLS